MEVGQDLQPITRTPTREQLRAYAESSRDRNPIHIDDGFARDKAGLPGVIVHGMLSMAFLADLVALNFPEAEWELCRFRARFRKVAFPGEALSCDGTVRDIDPDGLVQVAVSAKNPAGEITTDGVAYLRRK
ncbi:MAG: hypothetical protein KDD51_06545 [Bdellovibrionales bacterium]|nr:hypothetical protein [Bdellovibrionales bacterium]